LTVSAPTIIKVADVWDSLGGAALMRHFDLLDEFLWRALSVLGQTAPAYLSRQVLIPCLREALGQNHGRKWFLGGNSDHLYGVLVDHTRAVTQGEISWTAYLARLKKAGFYRDTLRQWVEDAVIEDITARKRVATYLNSYLQIREEITLAYLPLVWKIATSYGFSADSKEDLYQMGVSGLIHGIERYNNVGPVTFSTFTGRWIRQVILMHLSRKAPIIKVSHSLLERLSRINKKERSSGKKDLSKETQKLRMVSEIQDVVLVADPEAEFLPSSSVIDLTFLPKRCRTALILRHGLFEHARHNATTAQVDAEGRRQQLKGE